MNEPFYLDELTVGTEGKIIRISDSVSRALFSVMTPREVGKHFDIRFAEAITQAGFIKGSLVGWELRPFILGIGYVDDWNNWNGLRVFGSYEYLGKK